MNTHPSKIEGKEAQAQTESARALPAHDDSGDSPGAPLSNTAPSNNNRVVITVLRQGVDSLYLSYQGKLCDVVEESLDQFKLMAQSDDLETRARAILRILNHRFEVSGKGRGRFPFVLADNWFHIQLSRVASELLPMAYVQIRSELLSHGGINRPVDMLDQLINELGEANEQKISRVDVCVDFATNVNISAISSGDWVSRAVRLDRYEVNGQFTGYSFGLGGEFSARLYDKTKELQKSKKTWLYGLWADKGWFGETTVWRLEFQFRREVLKDFGISDVESLSKNLTALWKYATTKWLKLTVPSAKDQLKSRWPLHPLWSEIQNVSFGPDSGVDLSRIPKQRIPSDDQMFINGLGGLTTFMAIEGFTDIDEAIGPFITRAHEYHLWLYSKTGKTLKQYARLKAKEKQRKFNTTAKDPQGGDPISDRPARRGNG